MDKNEAFAIVGAIAGLAGIVSIGTYAGDRSANRRQELELAHEKTLQGMSADQRAAYFAEQEKTRQAELATRKAEAEARKAKSDAERIKTTKQMIDNPPTGSSQN